MQKRSTVSWFGMVLPLSLVASVAAAQSSTHRQEPPSAAAAPLATAFVAAPDRAALAPDSANPPESGKKKKKGGGLFGKVKGVAKNKVVQSVVKTAACTMVPGGQFVAGAIDAAANKNAVTGAAGAATGSSCAAGLGGMGMTPRVPGAQGADLANIQAAQAAAGGAGNAQMMAAMQMQAMTVQLAQMQRMSGAAGAVPGTMPGMPGGAMTGEGMGQPIAVTAEKNKTVIRNIDWVPGTGGVSATGAGPFQQALIQAGTAVLQAGGSYRLDLYMDKQSPDALAKSLGSQRLASVQTAFLSGPMAGQPNAVPLAGKIKRDGDPRLEIVKTK